MKRYEEIVLCKDNYDTEEGLWEALKMLVKILLDAGYITNIKYDEPGLGIICIDFNYADEDFGCPYPYWLTPEESDHLYQIVEDYNRSEYTDSSVSNTDNDK